MKSLHIRGWLQPQASGFEDIARIIVYYDSQSNGAAPTIQTLLQDSNVGAATSYNSEINLTNRQRFKILRDTMIHTPAYTNTAGVLTNMAPRVTEGGNVIYNEFIKLKGLETIFNATNGGTIADITSGAIGIVAFCAVNNNSWYFSFGTRLRYYD